MDNKMSRTVAANIRRYRKEAGLTQRDLAKKLGVAPSTVTGWEAANRAPGLDVLLEISVALGVFLKDLIALSADDPAHADQIFAGKLAAVRRKSGLTVSGMAAKLGVPAGRWTDWECGLSCPESAVIRKLCKLFSVTPNELFYETPCAEHQLSEDEIYLITQYRELDMQDKDRIRDWAYAMRMGRYS